MTSLEKFYDTQWRQLDDFIRYNPGSRHRRRLIGAIVKELRPSSILDAGCGNAELILTLLKLGIPASSLAGCDLSGEVVVRNGTNIPSVGFYQLDIESGHVDKKYDLVILSEVIEHLYKRSECLANLRAMLNPGGFLLITCPTGQVFPTEREFGHVSHPTPSELESLAKANGLVVKRIWNWGWPIYRLTKILINLKPDVALKKFAFSNYSLGAKALANTLYLTNYLNFTTSKHGCQLFCLMQANA